MAALSAALRAKTATVKQPNRGGGQQKNRFPLPTPPAVTAKSAVTHASMALEFVKGAKGLSPKQRAQITSRATAILGRYKSEKGGG